MTSYLSSDDVEDDRNAYGFGVPLAQIAANRGVSVDELRQLLELPALRPVPIDDEPTMDLWKVEQLEAQL